MSLFQTIAKKIEAQQKQDEKQFDEFIDESIKVVKGLEGPKQANSSLWARMQQKVKSFVDTKPGTESLDNFLDNNDAYQEQMRMVSLDFSASEREQRLKELQKDQTGRINKADDYIKLNSPNQGDN